MSRGDGFDIMDVSVAILRDRKVKRLARVAPDRWTVGVVAYLATMAASWEAGDRVPVEDAWPTEVPFDPLAVEALEHVDLLDAQGLINAKTWRSWFGKAKARRAKARADWRKYQANRRSRNRGGVSPESAPDNPRSQPYPSVRPSDSPSESSNTPQPPSRGGRRATKTNPRALAAEQTRKAEEAERERKARRNARYLAYQDGRLTREQLDDMNDCDAPLSEIPAERGAAFATPRLLA